VASYNSGETVAVGDVVKLGNEARIEVAVQVVARELDRVN